MTSRTIVLAALSLASGAAAQGFPDCVNGPLAKTTVCNTAATPLERATSLVSLMTFEEKVEISGSFFAVNVTRLGLPPYTWWSEALHGVANSPGVNFASGAVPWNSSTSFPQPILTAAAFDDDLVNQVATVISTEARAFNNYATVNAHMAGLDFWTPNINQFRDVRWGRGQETPGEDPFRTASYIRQLVLGLQGPQNAKYMKVAATCKHYAGYDIENYEGNIRIQNDVMISTQDLSEYYTPAFQSCARDSDVAGIMCSYNALNGVPSCADSYLLDTLLRGFWGWGDDISHWITSDCGAVEAIYEGHLYANNASSAAALALSAGTDFDCGYGFPDELESAYDSGLFNETTLDLATIRRYALLVRLGYFDPASAQPYRSLGWSNVNTPQAQSLAYNAAAMGTTLLKNDGTLPFKVGKGLSVALVGDWANATTQMQGNYFGVAPYLVSPLQALTAMDGVTVNFAPGIIGSSSSNVTDIPSVIAAAAESDVILFIGGIDTSIEAEGMDRTTIAWSPQQVSIINTLATYKKPMAVIQMGGGQVDSSFIKKNKHIGSLAWAGYPGQEGGQAIIDIVFGKVAPAGRLVTTMYPADYINEVAITDMTLRPSATNPGRTYMWYPDAVYPFGYGIHYTTFKVTASIPGPTINVAFNTASLVAACRTSGNVKYMDQCPFRSITVSVENTGNIASDYSALAFLSGSYGPTPYPIKRLAGYSRISHVGVAKTKTTTIPLTLGNLARVDDQGRRVLYPGTYKISIDTTPALASLSFSLTGPEIVLEDWPVAPAPAAGAYTMLGCFVDDDASAPALPYLAYSNSTNTIGTCATECTGLGYEYSGTSGESCYCGDVAPAVAAPQEDCQTICPPAVDYFFSIICGGVDRLSVAKLNF